MDFNGGMNGEILFVQSNEKSFDCGVYIEWNV